MPGHLQSFDDKACGAIGRKERIRISQIRRSLDGQDTGNRTFLTKQKGRCTQQRPFFKTYHTNRHSRIVPHWLLI